MVLTRNQINGKVFFCPLLSCELKPFCRFYRTFFSWNRVLFFCAVSLAGKFFSREIPPFGKLELPDSQSVKSGGLLFHYSLFKRICQGLFEKNFQKWGKIDILQKRVTPLSLRDIPPCRGNNPSPEPSERGQGVGGGTQCRRGSKRAILQHFRNSPPLSGKLEQSAGGIEERICNIPEELVWTNPVRVNPEKFFWKNIQKSGKFRVIHEN